MKITAVMCVKDVAEFVKPALESLSFADEIVVVDVKSTDKTIEIVKKFTQKVFHFDQEVNYVEPVRNFAISKATGDWILVLDADEQIPENLAVELKRLAQLSQDDPQAADCYYLPRKNMIFNHWVQSAGWWPDHILRFFKKGHVEWSDLIHSVPFTKGKVAELPAKESLAILHHNYRNIEEFVSRMNKYSSIQAREASDDVATKSKNSPAIAIKAFADEFLSRFFDRDGVSGGFHGTTLSISQAYSEFLVKAKIWQADDFPTNFEKDSTSQKQVIGQLDNFKKDLAYWIADWHVKNTQGLAKLLWRARRKLGL